MGDEMTKPEPKQVRSRMRVVDKVVGVKVVIDDPSHPHYGKAGVLTTVGELMNAAPFLGPMDRIDLDDGCSCYARSAAYSLIGKKGGRR